MSREQLLRLLNDAEASPALRRCLPLRGDWQQWLQVVQRLGYGVELGDVQEAERLEQAARFLGLCQVQPIKPLS
ncbi:MAG: hypothetical protein FJ077_06530 [Cyanobacteria bacterium K_DeepCast_35m_m2_023]|nr:hypothetical protein [Cyanobacteria bacterium K_DeepCast_35m_m2_023]